MASKIATCCYCGTRAALVLGEGTRHELACANCGAPLHDLKQMPKAQSGSKQKHAEAAFGKKAPKAKVKSADKSRKKLKKKKKSKSSFFAEVFDVIEDIFD